MGIPFFITLFFIAKTITLLPSVAQTAQNPVVKTTMVSPTVTPVVSLTPTPSPSQTTPSIAAKKEPTPTTKVVSSPTPTNAQASVSSIKIDSLSSTELSFNDNFVVRGLGFGSHPKISFYSANGTNLGSPPIFSASDTEIKTIIPPIQGNQTIQIEVQHENGTRSNKVTIQIKGGQPYIASISPEPVIGQTITVSGSNFGSSNGTVKFWDVASPANSATCSISSWSETQIVCTVPNITNKEYGIQVIGSDGRPSSATYRQVKCQPGGCG